MHYFIFTKVDIKLWKLWQKTESTSTKDWLTLVGLTLTTIWQPLLPCR